MPMTATIQRGNHGTIRPAWPAAATVTKNAISSTSSRTEK